LTDLVSFTTDPVVERDLRDAQGSKSSASDVHGIRPNVRMKQGAFTIENTAKMRFERERQ